MVLVCGYFFLTSQLLICPLKLLMQAIRLKYLHPDSELQNYAIQVMDMLRADTSVDAYTLVFFKQTLGLLSL